jgi:hypothetical protein
MYNIEESSSATIQGDQVSQEEEFRCCSQGSLCKTVRESCAAVQPVNNMQYSNCVLMCSCTKVK